MSFRLYVPAHIEGLKFLCAKMDKIPKGFSSSVERVALQIWANVVLCCCRITSPEH